MVHQPEDIQERAEPLIRGAGLVQIGGELSEAEPVGSGVVVERSPRFARWLRRGVLIASGLELALESLGLLIRCPEPVLEFGQTALERGPGGRSRRGASPCGGRLVRGDLQVPSQGRLAPAVISFFVLAVALQPVEVGLQPANLLHELLVASGHRRQLVALPFDRTVQPLGLGLLTGRLTANGLGLFQQRGHAVAIRAQGFELLARDLPLLEQSLNLVSEPLGLLAEEGDIPLELKTGGLQPLLPDPLLALGLVPFRAGPRLDLVDSGLELLLSGHARPQGGVEAIPVATECLQLVSQPGQPEPILFPVLEFGAEPIPLAADIRQVLRGRLVPQRLDLGPQPAVLRPESLQLILQSFRLRELALDSLELLLKVVQPGPGLSELISGLGELPESGFTLGRLGGQRKAEPLALTLSLRSPSSVLFGQG